MQTKPLLFGLIGFFMGGLLVSIAATTFDKPEPTNSSEQSISMEDMTANLANKQGDAFDQEFITQMIAHHQGAVDMAKLSAGQAKHDEIKQLSTDIIAAQEKEIDLMKQWQQAWGYSTQKSQSHTTH